MIAALQLGWLASQAPAWARFQRAARRGTQDRRLAELLAIAAPSAYGASVGLGRIRNAEAFQRDIPIVDYDTIAPWVARVAAGEARVFSVEAVEMLERTGGSSGGEKLIPYTARLRREFAEAVGVWMLDLHRRERLLGTRSYWSISRAVRRADTTRGGVRIGMETDAEYFGPVARWAIARLMAVPGSVAGCADMEAWRHATARHLLEAEDLGFISVWSPTFLTRLLGWIADHRGELDLSAGARARLDRAGTLHGPTLWPRLRVVSAWGDGFAAAHVPALMAHFPGVTFQPKGVLATEGVVSIPLAGGDPVLAVTAHVLELRDLEDGRVLWPHAARTGGRYQPILTTGAGLVRYALPDALEVTGWCGRVPRVRLRGRLDRGSDLVGEKLTSAFVQSALTQLYAKSPAFAMLVPRSRTELGYTLVTDHAVDPAAVERALRAATQYDYARELGQLSPAEVRVVQDGWARWERAIEAEHLVLGDQKPLVLETRPGIVAALWG